MANVLTILLKAVDQASGPIGAVSKSVAGLQRGLEPVSTLLGTGLKVAAGAAAVGLAALAGGIASSVSAAADMEQQLADIQASMGATSEETAQLKKLIGDMGLDPTLKVSATEAADAIQVLGTAGLSVDDIMAGAARSTVLLANSTGADLGQAAAIASDVMALFNIEAKDMKRAVDGITSTTVASKFGIDDYALALAQGGGVAATVGVEFDDFNATIAAIAPFFSSGADAGTSFKTFLQRLVPQSNDAKDAMRELGLITADGSNQFFDASGNMRSMTEISGVLHQALGGLSDAQKNAALSTIFGSDAMRAAAGIAEYTDVEFQQLKETMGKTDAEQAAATRMNTLKGAMEIMTGVVETLRIQIGDRFAPAIRQMTERFTEFLQNNGPRIIEWAGIFADNLAALVNWLMAVVEDGDTMNDWLTHMHPSLRNVVQGTVDLVTWVRNAVAAIGEFIAPITDVIGQFVSWKDVLIAVGIVIGAVAVSAISTFIAAAAPVVALVTGIIAVVALLRNAWEADWGGIQAKAASVWGFLTSGLDGMGQTMRTKVAEYTEILQGWGQSLYDSGNRAALRIGEGITNATNAVRDEVSRFMNSVREHGVHYATGELAGRLYESARSAFVRMAEGFAAASPNIIGDVQRAMDGITGTFNRSIEPFKGHVFAAAQATFTRIGDGFRSIDLGATAQGVLNGVVNAFNGTMDSFKNHAGASTRDLVGRISGALTSADLGGTMRSGLNGMLNAFNGMMDGFKNHAASGVQDLMGRIRSALGGDFGGTMRGALQGIIDAFNGVMDGFRRHVGGVMSGIGSSIIDGIRSGISGGINGLYNALNSLTSAIPQWVRDALGVHSPSTVFAELGRNLMQGFTLGIEELAHMPQLAVAGAVAGMVPTDNNSLSPGGTTINNSQSHTNNFSVSLAGGSARDPFEATRLLNALYGGASA